MSARLRQSESSEEGVLFFKDIFSSLFQTPTPPPKKKEEACGFSCVFFFFFCLWSLHMLLFKLLGKKRSGTCGLI